MHRLPCSAREKCSPKWLLWLRSCFTTSRKYPKACPLPFSRLPWGRCGELARESLLLFLEVIVRALRPIASFCEHTWMAAYGKGDEGLIEGPRQVAGWTVVKAMQVVLLVVTEGVREAEYWQNAPSRIWPSPDASKQHT